MGQHGHSEISIDAVANAEQFEHKGNQQAALTCMPSPAAPVSRVMPLNGRQANMYNLFLFTLTLLIISSRYRVMMAAGT